MALCGLPKLTVANLKDVLELLDIDADDYNFDRKDKMASFVYDSIVAMAKDNKKLEKEVENLEQQIVQLKDYYY